jgi:hypothetical protein
MNSLPSDTNFPSLTNTEHWILELGEYKYVHQELIGLSLNQGGEEQQDY